MAGRRANGEGSVFQRDDGRWCGTIDLGMVGGKRRRRRVYGRTQREVTDKLAATTGFAREAACPRRTERAALASQRSVPVKDALCN